MSEPKEKITNKKRPEYPGKENNYSLRSMKPIRDIPQEERNVDSLMYEPGGSHSVYPSPYKSNAQIEWDKQDKADKANKEATEAKAKSALQANAYSERNSKLPKFKNVAKKDKNKKSNVAAIKK